MKLNPIYPSDNPMEQLLYCFGGDGEGGGSDSGSTGTSTGTSTGSTHPGQPGGSAGERGAPTGADRGGFGQGGSSSGRSSSSFDAFDASKGYTSQAISNFASPSVGVMATPSMAASGKAGFSAPGSGVSSSGFGGGGGGFGGGGRSYGSYVSPIGSPSYPQAPDFSSPDAARSRAAIAAGAGVSPSTIVGSGPGGRNAVMSASGPVMSGRAVAEEAARQGTTVADIQSRISGAAAGLAGRSATEAVVDEAISPASDFDAFDLSKEYAAQAIADFDAQTRAQQAAATPAQGIVSAARAPATMAAQSLSRDEQAIADAQARNAARGITDITSGQQTGTVARDTTITPSDLDNPFGDSIFDSDAASAVDMADLAARGNMTAAELAAAGPAQAVTQAARSSALGGPTPGSMPGQAADIEVTYDANDLAEAQANLAAARDEAYSDKQFGFDTGLPDSFDVFGVQVPTVFGIAERIGDAFINPTASVGNIMAERGIKSVDGMSAEGTANYNPDGVEVVTSGGPLSEDGRVAVYDPSNNIVYDTRGIGSQIGDLLSGNRPPDNIQALYDRKNAIDDAEQASRGDRDDVLLFQDQGFGAGGGGGGGGGSAAPVDDSGRDIVGDYNYQPRGPISYSYTGLPSLAPTRLQPSFRARGSYSPLFPIG